MYEKLPIRAWEMHDPDRMHMRDVIDYAPQFDVTHVVFSHGIIWYAEDALDSTRRQGVIRSMSARAHRRGLKVWAWTHEINAVPERLTKDGRATIDTEDFWEWEREKYRRFFRMFPDVDGLVLTFHETSIKVYHDTDVISSLKPTERVAKLINTLHEVCVEFGGKDLVVRTFAYEPEELEWIREGLRGVHPDVMVESKDVPHDWNPYYPHNPCIGKFPERREIIEFHSAAEIGGRCTIPYTHPEFHKYHLSHALSFPNMVGYSTRVEMSRGTCALWNPNEVNVYALMRLAQEPDIDTEVIWKEWAEKRYGEKAAPFAIAALKRSYDASNKMFYALDFWLSNHSMVPDFEYLDTRVAVRSIAKWDPKPRYMQLEKDLQAPYPELLEEIMAEKDIPIQLIRLSLIDLAKGKEFFKPEDYEDLHWRFMLDLNCSILWRYIMEAYFCIKVLENHPSKALKTRGLNAVLAMEAWADITEAEYGEDIFPAEPLPTRNLAGEFKEILQEYNL